MKTGSLYIKSAVITLLVVFLLWVVSSFADDYDRDWNACIQKYRSEWGEPCSKCTYSNDIYKVYLKNVCEVDIDMALAVREEDKSWNCFYFQNLAPGDTVSGYACRGAGKYLFWGKKAGDKNISFPTCQEINEQYRK